MLPSHVLKLRDIQEFLRSTIGLFSLSGLFSLFSPGEIAENWASHGINLFGFSGLLRLLSQEEVQS